MTGFYIHIPFCAQKCSYCDFHFSTNTSYADQLVDCLIEEIKLRASTWKNEIISTLYFGGGTPSILSVDALSKLIGAVKENYHVSSSLEITMECNPEDCKREALEAWKVLGVSRLSMGVQSFHPAQLEWMNRIHTAEDTLLAVKLAKEVGFHELNLDIIYGLPEKPNYSLSGELDQLISLNPEHISAYCLTIEKKTALDSWVKSKKIILPENETQAQQFEILVNRLKMAGYEQYEISNFCRNEHYSKHNTAYWQGKKYIGIGPSAHGFDGKIRYWNISNNQQYMKAIQQQKLPESIETLTTIDCFNECVLLGLRTKWGVNKAQLFSILNPSNNWHKTYDKLLEQKLLQETDNYIVLTETGKLFADQIASDLFLSA